LYYSMCQINSAAAGVARHGHTDAVANYQSPTSLYRLQLYKHTIRLNLISIDVLDMDEYRQGT
jgi:hypothetical protein